MEIRIGIVNTGRELNFESDDTADAVRATVTQALESGAPHVTLSDAKGNSYIVPTAGLAYVELGTEDVRKVGFVA
ncbi:DUF3107 domain-containing protein [Microbacterium protaetiae]|uniref:DUF3107 domain-containing protein n=1 Tax=Microbacterium protaetiae TaxID=2509458 RepID=A0A4P6EFH0_9MICO|nr:DUF3107 domain-containing protein [Microbacterium protaetiae]QAY61035.1 DUF3107 domain-containing protein [Microbacterium protaetiae]